MGIDRGHGREQTELLDSKKALQLLILSFKFSQGSVYIQRLLFRWLHYRYPQFKILNYELLANQLSATSHNFLTDGKLHKPQTSALTQTDQGIEGAAL